MTPMQASCRSQRLIKRAEDHRKHDLEGAMKPADGVSKDLGMLGYGGGNPWMRELQQQGAPCAEKYCGFSVDSPGHRVRAKHAR
jgi:hypothetical protein